MTILQHYNIDRYAPKNMLRRYRYELIREETPTGTQDVLILASIDLLDRATGKTIRQRKVKGVVRVPEHVRREIRVLYGSQVS